MHPRPFEGPIGGPLVDSFAGVIPVALEKRWQLYERVIEDLERQHKDCKVTPNHHVKGVQSGELRQVDVWLEARVGGLAHCLTIAVECKDYGRKVGHQGR